MHFKILNREVLLSIVLWLSALVLCSNEIIPYYGFWSIRSEKQRKEIIRKDQRDKIIMISSTKIEINES